LRQILQIRHLRIHASAFSSSLSVQQLNDSEISAIISFCQGELKSDLPWTKALEIFLSAGQNHLARSNLVVADNDA
jgi:hypothetical protein